jgi:hypothetical protein
MSANDVELFTRHHGSATRDAGHRRMAEPATRGALLFLRRPGRRTRDYVLSPAFLNGSQGPALLRLVAEVEGGWELVPGGLLVVSVPAGAAFDPAEWARALVR